MADIQRVTLTWEQSKDFQILSPSAVTVSHFATSEGNLFALRLTTDWVKMIGEEFDALVLPEGIQQQSPGFFQQAGQKIELAAIKLSPALAGQLTSVLISNMAHFPPAQQAEIASAFATATKAGSEK